MTNRRGAIASERLTKALIDLAARGLHTHCQDDEVAELWLSESEPQRAQAARLCNGCAVSLECRGASVARREEFGVWSGVDRTVRHARGKATPG